MLEKRQISIRTISSLALLAGSVSSFAADAETTPDLAIQLRRPATIIAQRDRVLVGNGRSGTISILDPSTGNIVAEHTVAKRIADMAETSDGAALVLDAASRQLRKVRLNTSQATVKSLAKVPSDASKLTVTRDGRQVFVTARWSHQVLAFELDENLSQVEGAHSISLPFAPRELLLVNDGRTLLVADAFSGRIAIVDALRKKLLKVRKLNGHNVRGLALDGTGKQLLVAQQQMARHALADFEELHWGRLIANAVQVFDLADVLTGDAEQIAVGWLDAHGGIGGATADPSAVIAGRDGLMAVAFAGVGEVVVRRRGSLKRISVGTGPEAMSVWGERLYVANRFDDSVSVIDLQCKELVETVSLGPSPELSNIDRGEKLFYDARLAHEGWISCHSCHTDGHSSGLVVDTLGDGDYGAPKLVPSLLGTGDTGPWSWNGSMKSLGDQVRKSVATTMHGEHFSDRQISDLTAYLANFQPPPSPHREDSKSIVRGRAVFNSRGCADCHAAPTFTASDTFDVNLTDERDRSSFNPPSLRGVSQRQRFFHDGRASSLKDVLVRFRHMLNEPLSEEDEAALLAYLRSL